MANIKDQNKKEEKENIKDNFENKNIEQKRKSRSIKNDELIDVMNYTTGRLVYINPRSQQEWTFEGFGASDQIPFSELRTMKSMYPKFLFEPWMIILDEDVVQMLGLSKLYENILKPSEIDMFYKMNEKQMEKFLLKAPNNMKTLLIDITKEKIKNKEFGDLFKIKHMENILDAKILDE